MEDRNLLLNLSRILSGYFIFSFSNQTWKLKYPTTSLKYEADIISQIEYDENKYNEWPTLDSVTHLLVEQGLWEYSLDKKMESIDKEIEDLKVKYYQNFLLPSSLSKIRKDIHKQEKAASRLYARKHAFDYLTIEGHCLDVKNNYILARSIYDSNDTLYFLDNEDTNFLSQISTHIYKHNIDIATFRKIARSSQWYQYWGANKNNLFDQPVVDWTDEQRTLVSISNMYSAAREHPDSPNDKVFEDDYAFDGWSISERRRMEKERARSKTENMLPGKLQNAQEVFVMANSREEADEIYNLNDNQSAYIIKERQETIMRTQEIAEQHLPDIQREIIIDSRKNNKSTRK